LGLPVTDDGEDAQVPRVDPAMRAAITRALKSPPRGRRAADGLIAALLDESIRNPRESRSAFARAQSAELIGAWFCEVDALLPGRQSVLHDAFHAARLPVLKLALADRRVFSDPGHAVRRVLDNAMDASAPTALSQPGSRELIEAEVQSLLGRIADAADNVHPMMEHLAPLAPEVCSAFLDEARDRTAVRREELQRRARRVAAQELETQILGRSLPAPAVNFLRQGWVPMIATLLLRDGLGSTTVESGMALLPRLLAAIDGRTSYRQDPSLLPGIRAALIDAGQPNAPVDLLVEDLRVVLEAVQSRHLTRRR